MQLGGRLLRTVASNLKHAEKAATFSSANGSGCERKVQSLSVINTDVFAAVCDQYAVGAPPRHHLANLGRERIV